MPTRLRDFATVMVAVAEPETTALAAAQLMRKHHVGALIVVDALEKVRPLGIVTDRDLVLALMAEGLDPAIFTAGDIMSAPLVTASPEMDAMDAVRLMRSNRLRRLVITDDEGRLVGIVTMEDILEMLTRELADLAAGVIGARDREFEQRA
ncbi:CBS domain-containing protein [Polaromonas sp. DSR2-3-2]|uniref:CBS domain-containing protein n=1 Tax=unclassified Polaromonas TaxID=2638319 RepID=UPI003CF9A032